MIAAITEIVCALAERRPSSTVWAISGSHSITPLTSRRRAARRAVQAGRPGARRDRGELAGLGRAAVHRRRPAAQQADEDRQHHLDHVVGGARVVDRALAEAARVHRDVHLVDPQPVVVQHQDRLDLGVVVRVVAGEELDPVAVDHPEAGGRVGDRLTADPAQHDAEDPVAEPPAPGAPCSRGRRGSASRRRGRPRRRRCAAPRASPGCTRACAARRRRPEPRPRSRDAARTCSRPASRRRSRG